MGFVGGGEVSEFLVSQFEFGGLDRVFDMVSFGGSDDRRGYSGLMKDPGERNLGIRDAPFLCGLSDMLDNLEIVFLVVKPVSKFVGFRADGFALISRSPIAGEEPSG